MKKAITVILLVFMLASIMVQPVAAAGMQASMSASTQSVKPGDTIDFNISVSSDATCDQFGLILEFDRDNMEFVSGSCSVAASLPNGEEAVAVKNFSKASGKEGIAVSFFEAIVYSGKVGKFTLRVKEGAPTGDYTVTFRTSAKRSAEVVPFGAASVSVNVSKVEETKPTTPEPTDPQPTEPKPTEHKHTYSTKWSYNKTQHWHECTGCGEKKDVKKHTPGPEATETEHQRCTVCKYVIKQALGHTHDYGNKWVFDANRHWRVCECGEESEIAEHTWDSNGLCKTCYAEKVEETKPQDETTAPDETTQPTETTEGTQPSRPVAPPVADPTEPVEQGFSNEQWSTGGLILALLVAAVIVAYFLIAQKRQK